MTGFHLAPETSPHPQEPKAATTKPGVLAIISAFGPLIVNIQVSGTFEFGMSCCA